MQTRWVFHYTNNSVLPTSSEIRQVFVIGTSPPVRLDWIALHNCIGLLTRPWARNIPTVGAQETEAEPAFKFCSESCSPSAEIASTTSSTRNSSTTKTYEITHKGRTHRAWVGNPSDRSPASSSTTSEPHALGVGPCSHPPTPLGIN